MRTTIRAFVSIYAVVFATYGQPVERSAKPGPHMLLGTSVMSDDQNQVVKSIGFSHSQTDSDHLTVNETSPGVWDWSQADAGLAAMKKAGMQWQYFPHFHFAPEWYRKTDEFVPSIGLRSKRELTAMSLWSPDIVPWFNHGYAALAKHYGTNIFAIYLGVHGDFGETIFPMGWHPDEKKRFEPPQRPAPDFWCGDKFARADFQKFARAKYKSVRKLNAAWSTQFQDFNKIDFPPQAYDKNADVISTPQSRRRWLDFVDWYYDSMTKFTGEVCRIARHHFPNALLQLPVGGGSEDVLYGQDTTAIPKIARKYDVHIRSTHGGFQPFAQNYGGMLKKIATPCKFYNVPHWLEPPGAITPDGEVSRIMEAISCGNYGFWDWGANPLTAADVFRKYTNFFSREKPIVDVAFFFPTTDHRLHPQTTFPQKLQADAAALRDVMDFDMVDEALITDDALKNYRVLIWSEGRYVEQRTLEKIYDWINKGGTIVWRGTNICETVEGDTKAASVLFGIRSKIESAAVAPVQLTNPAFLRHLASDTNATTEATVATLDRKATVLAKTSRGVAAWAMPNRKGWSICAPALGNSPWHNFVRDAVYNLRSLDRSKSNAAELDRDFDGVYTTDLLQEIILYNSTSEDRYRNDGGNELKLPLHSLRSQRGIEVFK